MLESEKMAIAAHLHVVMRRKIGRVTDIEWLMRNAEYAREVIRLATLDPLHADLVEWGERLQAALFPAPEKPEIARASGFGDSRLDKDKPPKPPAPRYVNTLR